MEFRIEKISHTFRNKYIKSTGSSVISSSGNYINKDERIDKWFYEDENGNLHSRLNFASDLGITAYAQSPVDIPTIMDGVVTDEVTITKNGGILKVIGGGGGSGDFDVSKMWSALEGSTDEQINKSHLTTALSDYVTDNTTFWGQSIKNNTVSGDMTKVGLINDSIRIEGGFDKASIRGNGHGIIFGGGNGYAHCTYAFRPEWGSQSETQCNVEIQNASAASSNPTYTTTHSFTSDGTGYHRTRLGVARTAGSGSGIYTNTIRTSDWFRSEGNTGWYSENYGGGWYMTDSSWIRAYNNKHVRTEGNIYAGTKITAVHGMDVPGMNGSSWNQGEGAYQIAVPLNENQTPLVLAYRKNGGNSGGNRLFAMELLNGGGQINFSMAGSTRMSINRDTNTATFSGNILANGGITQYSDQRAKDVIEDVDIDLDTIANSPAVRYKWNGYKNREDDGKTHVGGIAQYMKEVLPEVIYESGDLYTMDYSTTSYIYSVNIAKHLVEAKREINELKEQINLLKDEIKSLKSKQ